MLTYIIRRLLLMIPTLLGITIIVFTIMAAAPGGVSSQSLVGNIDMEPEARQALTDYYNKLYGLDQPAPIQYLRWLNNVSFIGFDFDDNGELDGFSLFKTPYLGKSFIYNRSVLDLIKERIPITLLLNLLSVPLIYLIAITIGVRAATKRGESFDVGTSVTMLGLWSVPTMLAGVMMLGYFASVQNWHWFPTAGLSSREALDMPFMPHWSGLWDVVILFASTIVFTLGFIFLSNLKDVKRRAIILAAVGVWLAVLMSHNHAGDNSIALGIFLVSSLGLTFYGLGLMDYPALRTFSIGLIGFGIGAGIGLELQGGEFERGFLMDRLWHLVLPLLCLSYGGFAFLSKLTRSAVLENLQSDYARTARAKGVAEKDVLWRHVFRNSLLPLITVFSSLLPAMLAGSVIVESIFSIDGMGKLAVDAVKAHDRELVLSITLIMGVLTLLGNLLADILYAVVDPRISYD